MNSTVVQARTTEQVAKLGDWCRDNLTKSDYDFEIVTMFPLWVNFRFHCPKQQLMAILST